MGPQGSRRPRVPSEKPVILCAAEALQARIATLMHLRLHQCILQLAYTHGSRGRIDFDSCIAAEDAAEAEAAAAAEAEAAAEAGRPR